MREANLVKEQETRTGNNQKLYRFDNGYGASVISGSSTYGGNEGLWELAVIAFETNNDWDITYDTPITDNVIGYLDEDNVDKILEQIEAL